MAAKKTSKPAKKASQPAKKRATTRAAQAKRGASGKPTSIDGYLAQISGARRATLEKLRETLRALLPGVEECISYGLPAFRLDGRVVAGFAATRQGCSYYPFSGTTLKTLRDEVANYETSSGALQFDAEQPLPRALVRKLLAARIAEA